MQKENKLFFNKYAFNKKLIDFLNDSNYLSPFRQGVTLAIIAYCIDLISVEIPNALSVAHKVG
ncbi:MAG: hypothetical protein JG770_1437 [Mahella sp.]|nr:hypothetical protein [Mahella sp.]